MTEGGKDRLHKEPRVALRHEARRNKIVRFEETVDVAAVVVAVVVRVAVDDVAVVVAGDPRKVSVRIRRGRKAAESERRIGR